MQFIERVTGMFTQPEETIKDILKEPRIEEPLVIVGIYAIIFVISAIFSSLYSGNSLSVLSVVITIIFTFAGWAIATGVVHALALFMGGEGKYNPQMLNAIGYTYIVKYIPAIIGIILLFFIPVVNTSNVSQVTAGMSIDQIKSVMQPLITSMGQMLFNPVFILSQVITYIGWIWSGYLGALAVKNGDKVSRAASLIAVYVPMVIAIVLSVMVTYGSYFMLKMFYG